MITPGGEEPFEQRRITGPLQQLAAGQRPFGVSGMEVEGDPAVGGPVQGEMPVEKSLVVADVRPLVDQLPQGTRLFHDVQLAGVASHPGEEQDLGGTGDPDPGGARRVVVPPVTTARVTPVYARSLSG